jgi:thiamine biosynthesis lipoprotein
MASDCEVRVAGVALAQAQGWAQHAITEVRRIEAKFSRYLPASIVSRINASAGDPEGMAVDDETAQLLNFAHQLFMQSDGLFDITSGVLRQAWDFKAARLPLQDELDALLPKVGWHMTRWESPHLVLPLPGMEVDFGGFGKEYAADRAAAVLANAGARYGLVNLGGDISVIGPQPDGKPWSIGIRHPRQPDQTIASISLARGGLATSGDYERFFVQDGKRFCHLLDPRSGWPVAHWQSMSIVAPVCVAAGAVSTIAMLKQAEAGDFLAAQQVAFLAIDADGVMTQRGLPAAPAVVPERSPRQR